MASKLSSGINSQSKELSKTCFNCKNLEPDGYRSGNSYHARFDCNLEELQKAISRGCEICSFVRAAIEQVFDREYRNKIKDVSLRISTLSDQSAVSLSQSAKDGEGVDRSVFVESRCSMKIVIGIRDHPRYSNVIRGRTYNVILQSGSLHLPWVQLCNAKSTSFFGSTGSNLAVAWVQDRLEECHQSHSECSSISSSRPSKPPYLPKRIIEIVGDQHVRLREPIEERAHYACLSHCWGDATILTTETVTLHRHLNEIIWNELPKTFQDAITFLQCLQIRFLWIDSLCIIQDSDQDWLEQSGKMADIYSFAYITIAATKAANCNAGLFTNSHEVALDYENTRLLICEQPKHAHPGEVTSDTFPLLTRGWVAQEMLLSTNVLHFSNGELVHECMRSAVCSCSTTEKFSRGDYGRKDPIWNTQTEKVFTPSKSPSHLASVHAIRDIRSQNVCSHEEKHFCEWRQMLMNYSDLELSFEKDRFPAISGLARRFSNKFKATYAAGLWVENLHNDLLWVMPHRVQPEQRRLDAGAPTWSWASCGNDTSSYQSASGSHLYFTVMAVNCVPLSRHDPFGQLEFAQLTLQAPLIPFRLKPSRKGYDAQLYEQWGIEVEPDLNLTSILVDANDRRLFFGLPIVRQEMGIRGLILHRQDDNVYRRVGLWFCSSKEGYYQQFDPPEWWRAETLHEEFGSMQPETVVIV